jgi:hypothetical protein
MKRETQDAIRERLQALCDESGGRLTPDAVVADARDPESPLHEQFEWNDEKAAGQHRLAQARALIRSVEVIFKTDRTVLRAPYFVRDPSAGHAEQGYVSTSALRSEEDLAREALVNEFANAAHILRRARNLAKVLGMDEAVGAMLDGVMDLRERAASAPLARV